MEQSYLIAQSIIGGFVIAVAVGLGGYYQAKGANTTTVTVPPVNESVRSCSEACNQLEAERQANCQAIAALAAANARVTALIAELAIAAAAAIAAWVGVAVTSSIPIWGWGAALALAIAATALSLIATYLTGQLVAAQSDLNDKQAAANQAMAAVVDARNVVLSVCEGQALQDCLNRPSPCG
jgi:hypothetical protein